MYKYKINDNGAIRKGITNETKGVFKNSLKKGVKIIEFMRCSNIQSEK